MAVFKCKIISDEIRMNVHKEIKWLKPQDLIQLDWAPADLPIAQKIYDMSK